MVFKFITEKIKQVQKMRLNWKGKNKKVYENIKRRKKSKVSLIIERLIFKSVVSFPKTRKS